MRFLAVLFTLFTVVGSALLRGATDVRTQFNEWKAAHNVAFASAEEELERLRIFAENHIAIAAHNAQPDVTYTLAHNKFSVLTEKEFGQLFFGLSAFNNSKWWQTVPVQFDVTVDVPASVDWVSAGAVTGVKDQGQCGSCWSFSTTGALEGAYFLKSGKLVSFSEQQLVDCDSTDSGCNGGWMDNAFTWVQAHGLTTEASYPYTATQGTCQVKPAVLGVGVVQGFVDVPSGDENALQVAVAQAPVSVAIQANQLAFQFYSSGVLTGTCGRRLDHGVLAVGYGVDNGTPYWKVKNSWGTGWGEGGYVRIQRGVDKCGIADAASYPVLGAVAAIEA
jgi:KDEL-tailed cysteine endopeptidase